MNFREAKASGGDLVALKSRLESAEKGFQESSSDSNAQLQTARGGMGLACKAKPPRANRSWEAEHLLNRRRHSIW